MCYGKIFHFNPNDLEPLELFFGKKPGLDD